jgi:hypothetical protein
MTCNFRNSLGWCLSPVSSWSLASASVDQTWGAGKDQERSHRAGSAHAPTQGPGRKKSVSL